MAEKVRLAAGAVPVLVCHQADALSTRTNKQTNSEISSRKHTGSRRRTPPAEISASGPHGGGRGPGVTGAVCLALWGRGRSWASVGTSPSAAETLRLTRPRHRWTDDREDLSCHTGATLTVLTTSKGLARRLQSLSHTARREPSPARRLGCPGTPRSLWRAAPPDAQPTRPERLMQLLLPSRDEFLLV